MNNWICIYKRLHICAIIYSCLSLYQWLITNVRVLKEALGLVYGGLHSLDVSLKCHFAVPNFIAMNSLDTGSPINWPSNFWPSTAGTSYHSCTYNIVLYNGTRRCPQGPLFYIPQSFGQPGNVEMVSCLNLTATKCIVICWKLCSLFVQMVYLCGGHVYCCML